MKLLVFLLPAALWAQAPQFTYEVVRSFPHDRSAFTQGLEYRDGVLYEGTGLEGRSTLRKVRLEDGRVLQQIPIDRKYFGEGITVLNGEVFQITWQSHEGFVYNLADFKQKRTFTYKGEGWGLTNNGSEIFMSDGTAELRVLDPKTLAEKRRIKVTDGAKPLTELNELEWVDGELLANVWQTDRIARISPATGKVTGWIDLTGLLSPSQRSGADVLNGIAYDKAGKRLFVTGKLWPAIYEIKLTPKRR